MEKNKNRATEYIYSLYDGGLLDEYSENHFLIKAMKGELDYFKEYSYLGNKNISDLNGMDFSSTFLMNFSIKLKLLASIFNKNNQFEEFIQNQLAAGKENYSDDKFFQALSEINVLQYLSTFCGKVDDALYEPKLGEGNTNPEARFEFDNNVIFDIEVKTANFGKTLENEISTCEGKDFLIKLNFVLSEDSKVKLNKYCDGKNIGFFLPRVLKLKDFIENAGKKFEDITHEKHFNILFINWTYVDYMDWKLDEPTFLLTNPINGILYNEKVQETIGLDKNCLNKISAIVLYRDNIDTLSSQDFRYHFAHRSVKLILNENLRKINNFDLLCTSLYMNPYDVKAETISYAECICRGSVLSNKKTKDALRFIRELWNSDF